MANVAEPKLSQKLGELTAGRKRTRRVWFEQTGLPYLLLLPALLLVIGLQLYPT
jgi:hypothetical protein